MRFFLSSFVLIAVSVFFSNCRKAERVPLLTTISPNAGVNVYIQGSAVVYSEGDAPITDKGYCWSTSSNPDISDNTVSAGSGPENFSVTIRGLKGSTRYYVRAFATNDYGTGYGEAYEVLTGVGPAFGQLRSSGIYSMTLNSAISSASITKIKFTGEIVEAGICWAAGTTPSTLDAHSSSKPDVFGAYTVSLSNLNANTTYNYRHYVINEAGVSYGNMFQFRTYAGTIQDFDNNTYYTVQIGNQVWLAENLRVKHFADGTPIANLTGINEWYASGLNGGYCLYENNSTNFKPHGLLYDYNAVFNAKQLAIPGWHVPSQSEYQTLFNSLNGFTAATASLKSADPSAWLQADAPSFVSGLSMLPSGYRNYNGYFYYKGSETLFWTTSVDQFKSGYLVSLTSYYNVSFNYFGSTPGASVRLIKN